MRRRKPLWAYALTRTHRVYTMSAILSSLLFTLSYFMQAAIPMHQRKLSETVGNVYGYFFAISYQDATDGFDDLPS